MKLVSGRDSRTPRFIVLLFTIDKETTQCLFNEYVKKMWKICIMEFSLEKEANLVICDSVDESGVLSKIIKVEKDKHCTISLVWGISKS